jgi:hypothetical protein
MSAAAAGIGRPHPHRANGRIPQPAPRIAARVVMRANGPNLGMQHALAERGILPARAAAGAAVGMLS